MGRFRGIRWFWSMPLAVLACLLADLARPTLVGAETIRPPGGGGERLLLLDLEGPGVAPELRVRVRERLQSDLGRHRNFQLLDTQRASLIDDMFELMCLDLDADCWTRLAAKYAARRILLVELARGEDGLAVDLRLIDGETGHTQATFRRVDVLDDEAVALAGSGLESLIGAPEPTKGTVIVRATVPGAHVRIADLAAGEVPFTWELLPGEYPIIVSKEGYQDHVRNVKLRSGSTTRVDVVLQELPPVAVATPTPVAPPPEPAPLAVEEVVHAERAASTPLYKRWWFWTGVGAVVAGGVLTSVLLLHDTGGGPKRGHLDFSLRPGDIGRDPALQAWP